MPREREVPIEQEVRGRPNAPEFTADDYKLAIEYAMRDRNFGAVVSLLKQLAVIDADRADTILQTIKAGLDVAVARFADDLDATTEAIVDGIAGA